MKAVTIDSSLELKQVEYESFDIVYRRCGYRSINNFVALANEQFTDESTVLEFWGKQSKTGYDYRGHKLYGKCVIILKKGGEIIDLTIDGYNEITLFGANGDKQAKSFTTDKSFTSTPELEDILSRELMIEDYIYTSDESDDDDDD